MKQAEQDSEGVGGEVFKVKEGRETDTPRSFPFFLVPN
jgi:hypothetical protein